MSKMTQVLRTLAVGIGALALLVAQGGAAVACVGGPLDGKTDVERADVVFTGTVVRLDDRRGEVYSSADLLRWTFVVDAVEKGQAGERVVVVSERFDASCGVQFRLGSRYRVYATDRDEGLYTGQGYGTERVEALGDPPAVEGEFVVAESSPLSPLTIAVALVLGAVLYLVVGSRRSRNGPGSGRR